MTRYYWMPSAAFVLLFALLYVWTRFGDSTPSTALPLMPSPLTDDEQAELYLTPAGRYTAADIRANGRLTAATRYRGFQASHDPNPQPGDPICPITQTKANPECRWVIGGQEYQFCCPPCIDEFVRLARNRPDEVLPPDAYVT